MKIMKRILNIIFIFTIIQIFGMILGSNEIYATNDEGFFERAFNSGRQWSEMGSGSAESVIENNANTVFKDIGEIYTYLRYIGIAIFMVSIGVTIMSLSMKDNNGQTIAGAKLTIGIMFLLAVLFIFAGQIMDILTSMFEQFESLM